jgi:hypothetical protein
MGCLSSDASAIRASLFIAIRRRVRPSQPFRRISVRICCSSEAALALRARGPRVEDSKANSSWLHGLLQFFGIRADSGQRQRCLSKELAAKEAAPKHTMGSATAIVSAVLSSLLLVRLHGLCPCFALMLQTKAELTPFVP